ncbi:MAG: hypothetical protein AAGH41_04440 [Pseudomonadota bacterium]
MDCKGLLRAACAASLAACGAELPMATPELEGPLTEGRWEQRGRAGLTFWPPSPEETRLPEIIDFSCIDGSTTEIRFTVTGDTDRTGFWIAEAERTARDAVLVTSAGVTRLEFFAGQQKLPSVQAPIDSDWLQPLLEGRGQFALNAFGGRTYRLNVSPLIKETVEGCRRRRTRARAS